MEANRCPHLGLPDDPLTRLDFPSPGNICHKAAPPGPIKLDYQHNTCLTGQHITCPIYTAARPIPIPAAIQAPVLRSPVSRRQRIGLIVLPLALLLLLFLGILFSSAANSGQNRAGAGDGSQDPTRSGLFGLPQTGGNQRTATPNPTLAMRSTTCPMPNGWMTYTVNPTDSLYRLSVVHEISIEKLQRGNCMGSETVILPGQVIYIPFTPTLTPTLTTTPTRFIPTRTFTQRPEENVPAPAEPTDDNNPPTSAPPTAVPPTQAPPTAAAPTTAPTETPGVPPIVQTLVPIFPTAAPTATQPPPAPTDSGGGTNNRSQTIDCGGGSETVSGNNNSITFTGVCQSVTIIGNNNNITVPAGTPVIDLGNNNTIREG